MFLEKRLLCHFLHKFDSFTKKDSKIAEDIIKEYYELSSHRNINRVVRASCYMNLLINVQYELGLPVSDQMKYMMRESTKEFKDSRKQSEIRVMYPIIKLQLGRFYLLEQQKSIRKFIYNNVIVASHFIGEKEMHLEDYGMACYMVAAKHYESLKLNSWNLVVEFVHYNLGGISITKGSYVEALYYYIHALNSSRLFNGDSTHISQKSLAKVLKLSRESLDSKEPVVAAKAKQYIAEKLSSLECSYYDFVLEDEIVNFVGDTESQDAEEVTTALASSTFLCIQES